MPDFLICYEHINREVENDSLIKYELEKRGYSCEIMHFNGPDFFRYALPGKRAAVVAAPWLRYDDDIYHFLLMAQKSKKIVNLQWEQVYTFAALESGMAAIAGQSKKASHICWGENQKVRLSESGIGGSRLPVTGAIQMDYGRPLFQDYYLDRDHLAQDFSLNRSKRWFLLISSFPYANYNDADLKKLEARFGTFVLDVAALHRRAQAAILEWVQQLLKIADCEFIYRPHPSENLTQQLKDMEAQYPNFHIISTHSVKQWAKVCDKVNLWISTSNAEIAAMGVDYLVLRPEPIPSDLEVESMGKETIITDCASFIRENLRETSANDTAAKLQNLSWFYSYDPETPAYIKVADYLEQVLKTDTRTDYSFSWKQRVSYGYQELKQLVVSFLLKQQLTHPQTDYYRHLPLRDAVKDNLRAQVENTRTAKAVEGKTLQYMKEHHA